MGTADLDLNLSIQEVDYRQLLEPIRLLKADTKKTIINFIKQLYSFFFEYTGQPLAHPSQSPFCTHKN